MNKNIENNEKSKTKVGVFLFSNILLPFLILPMAFKKISLLFVGLIPLISGCTLPGISEKVDFESLYKEHVKSEMKSVRTLAEKLGYVGKYETKGSIRAFVDIPTIFSGAADTLYDAVIE